CSPHGGLLGLLSDLLRPESVPAVELYSTRYLLPKQHRFLHSATLALFFPIVAVLSLWHGLSRRGLLSPIRCEKADSDRPSSKNQATLGELRPVNAFTTSLAMLYTQVDGC